MVNIKVFSIQLLGFLSCVRFCGFVVTPVLLPTTHFLIYEYSFLLSY